MLPPICHPSLPFTDNIRQTAATLFLLILYMRIFKYIKHPLFNDKEYGGNEILKGTTFARYKQFVNNCFEICPRQALHAKTLGFEHPTTGERLSFDSEIPDDMQQLIQKWRAYIQSREE